MVFCLKTRYTRIVVKIQTQKLNKITVAEIILTTVATVGVLSIALVAPNALKLLRLAKKKYDPKYYLAKKTKQMIKQGLLKEVVVGSWKSVSLTSKGERALKKYRFQQRPKQKWDGKWRVVIFDVWEKSRILRDALRKEIKQIGFIQLQQSVWIYPYDCEDYIELLKSDLKFGKNVRYMIVEKLDSDSSLRKQFNL